jgi:glycosyltransferase involved in cell wall biosynthesis
VTPNPPPIDLVCFWGRSGLADYLVSLGKRIALQRPIRVVTSAPLDERYDGLEGEYFLPFRRARHYPIDIWKFFYFYLRSAPRTLLLQSWFFSPLLEGILLRILQLRGHRLFITIHDTLPHHPHFWSRAEMAFYYGAFNGLVAHSDASEADLRSLGVKAPIEAIPHATHDLFMTRQITQSEARAELGLPAGKVIYLQFGHIDARKGILEFCEVAQRCADVEGAHFVVAGSNDLSGDDAKALEAYRRLSNLTVVEGFIPLDAVQLYFTAANVVAAPYREGTTSGVYRLAVGFGRPVIASAIGDLKDAISAGTAFPLGTGAEVVEKFESFVRAHLEDLPDFALPMLRLMEEERQSNTWEAVAERYLRFLAQG